MASQCRSRRGQSSREVRPRDKTETRLRVGASTCSRSASLRGLSLTALADWGLPQNRLTLDLSGRLAVLEDGALPGDVEVTALVQLEDDEALGEALAALTLGIGWQTFWLAVNRIEWSQRWMK